MIQSNSYYMAEVLAQAIPTFAMGSNLFVGLMPKEPANCVAIYDTGGWPKQLTYKKGENYFHPTAQLQLRNTSYAAGWNALSVIVNELHGVAHVQTTDAQFSIELIKATDDIFYQGRDNNGRHLFSINFEMQVKPNS